MIAELHRDSPLIDIRWLTSPTTLHFAGALLLMRIVLAEQTVGASNFFQALGIQNEQTLSLYTVILCAILAGGLTCALLSTASGAKMGKTAAGAVWLDAGMLSPYDYWQFWRNTEDADVGRFLKLFTLLPMDEIARLSGLQGAEINEAKKVLATEATALMHGREAAEAGLPVILSNSLIAKLVSEIA